MKTTKIYFILSLLATILAACTKDNSIAEQQAGDDVPFAFEVVEQPWDGETLLVTRSGETLEGLRAIGSARLWNFQSVPDADVALLNESKNAEAPNTPLWTYDDGTKTYTSATVVYATLKGGTEGTTELSYTEGLRFSAESGNIHIVNNGENNCIRLTGDLTIFNLKAGQTVTIELKSPVGEARTVNVSNVSGSPVITATPGGATDSRTVAANGSVTFKSTADINIYSISVSKAEDDGFGLYCSELGVSNTQVTWDNANGRWAIGGSYNTYWRRNQSGTLDIYAYAPYKTTPYTVDGGVLTFEAERYPMPEYNTYLSGSNVDLLYASSKGYARNSSAPAILTFKHALAKMTFGTITNDTGGPLNLTGFTIRGTMYNSANLNLNLEEDVWSGHVINEEGVLNAPPPFIVIPIPPLPDKGTILPPMPNRELTFIPRADGTLPLTVEINSSIASEKFSFNVILEQGKNKTYNITIGKNYEVVIQE